MCCYSIVSTSSLIHSCHLIPKYSVENINANWTLDSVLDECTNFSLNTYVNFYMSTSSHSLLAYRLHGTSLHICIALDAPPPLLHHTSAINPSHLSCCSSTSLLQHTSIIGLLLNSLHQSFLCCTFVLHLAAILTSLCPCFHISALTLHLAALHIFDR